MITTAPKIMAIAPWFGGKRTLALEIVAELGPHTAYWEPFCGSMAVLLAKPECRMETVNDLHGDLINLAKVIQHPELGPDLYRRLRRAWMDEELYNECVRLVNAHEVSDQPSVGRAFSYFVSSWLGRNGTSGLANHRVGKAFCVRYTKNGGHGATRFRSCIESIPQWRRRMRGVTILRRDAFDLLPRIEDAAGVVIYIDSPYIEKNGQYAHDFTGNSELLGDDHTRLARELSRFKKTRVVVSYYEHPRLAELYPAPQWSKRSIIVSKAMAHQNVRGENNTKAHEVLLVNGRMNFGAAA